MIEQSEDLPYGNGGVFVVRNAITDYTDLSTGSGDIGRRRYAENLCQNRAQYR